MTRVIHTGDTHIGYQQYHSPDRRQDFLDAFRRVITDAVEGDVDAVVHAGDLFHDRRPGLQDILGTLSVLRTLADAEIPFLAVVGNHESKRDAQWLDLFESLDLAVRLDATPTVVGDVAFYGLDYVPRAQRDALEYAFDPHDATAAALVTHGLFRPFDHGDWDAATVLRESTVDFDAMLLGDNHTPGRAEVEDAWVTYCGSTERASASERDERGYNLVEFDDGVQISRRGLPTRAFEFVDVELAPGEGVERVTEQVGQYDLTDAVGIVTIEGDGERIAPAEIESLMRERGALVARVNDRREFDEVDERTVRFTDPDEAVRERVRELGLSPVARSIDEVVRESKVADSNVAEAVEQRVNDQLDDLESFERAERQSDPDTQERERELAESAAETDETAETTNVDDTTDTNDRQDQAGREVEQTTPDGGTGTTAETGTETRADTDRAPADQEDQTDDEDTAASDSTSDAPDGGDGQSTWGDYA